MLQYAQKILRCYPLLIELLGHSAKYWLKLCDHNMKSLVKNPYLNLYSDANKHQNWASSVNNLWVTCYMSEIWINQGSLYKNKIVKILKNFFYNKYAQLWWEYIDREESKLRKFI